MTKYITQAVYNGTKQDYAIVGMCVNSIMMKVRRMKQLRTASCFIFYSRKTGKMVDIRMN